MKHWIKFILIGWAILIGASQLQAVETTRLSMVVNTIANGVGYKPDINYDLEKYISGSVIVYNKGFSRCIIIIDVFTKDLWIIQANMILAGVGDITQYEALSLELEFPGFTEARGWNSPIVMPSPTPTPRSN